MADAHDPTTMGALLAVAIGLTKVLEALVTWAVKKISVEKPGGMIVQLSPEVSQMVREVHTTVSKTNNDGVPLIYGPRAEVHSMAAALESDGEKIKEIDAKTDSILDIVSKKQ